MYIVVTYIKIGYNDDDDDDGNKTREDNAI